MKVETVERIKQTSDVIADATSVLSEVTVEAEVRVGINTSERGYFLQRGNKVTTYNVTGGAYSGESTRLGRPRVGCLFFPDCFSLYYAYVSHCFPDVPTVLTRRVCLTARHLLHNDHVCCWWWLCDLNDFLKKQAERLSTGFKI